MNALPRGLYGIVDVAREERDEAVLDRARFLVDHGVSAVQLRAKHHAADAVEGLATRLLDLVPLLIVNDHADIALRLGVWAHLGQEDLQDVAGGGELPHGLSTHTLDQVRRPGSACYIGFGPVFGTQTKATGYLARGTALLAEAVRLSSVPVVAIGGIHVGNIDEVRATGVHAWAPISGFWDRCTDEAALRRLLSY